METIPHITVEPNNSGIEVSMIEHKEPGWLFGEFHNIDGKRSSPDIPSRTMISVKPVHSLHNSEPRYFISASGIVQVVSVERYSDYGGAKELASLRKLLKSADVLGSQEQPPIDTSQLSEIPGINAGRTFMGKLHTRNFPWGNAAIFLTSYVREEPEVP